MRKEEEDRAEEGNPPMKKTGNDEKGGASEIEEHKGHEDKQPDRVGENRVVASTRAPGKIARANNLSEEEGESSSGGIKNTSVAAQTIGRDHEEEESQEDDEGCKIARGNGFAMKVKMKKGKSKGNEEREQGDQQRRRLTKKASLAESGDENIKEERQEASSSEVADVAGGGILPRGSQVRSIASPSHMILAQAPVEEEKKGAEQGKEGAPRAKKKKSGKKAATAKTEDHCKHEEKERKPSEGKSAATAAKTEDHDEHEGKERKPMAGKSAAPAAKIEEHGERDGKGRHQVGGKGASAAPRACSSVQREDEDGKGGARSEGWAPTAQKIGKAGEEEEKEEEDAGSRGAQGKGPAAKARLKKGKAPPKA